MKLCKKDLCSSCGTCVSICPKNAISMKKDKYGYLYPQINEELCVNCGLCTKKCHILNDIQKNYPKSAYAVWSSDPVDRKSSTSGGAASVFYQYVCNNNGVCYGATYDENLNVVIEGYDDNRIVEFKQSKYVHSDMNDSYEKIKKNLNDKKQVVFIGLPCQIASLKLYLGKEYDNLLLVDIICHGTPPQEYLTSHIKNLEDKYNKKANKISFRNDNEFIFSLYEKDSDKSIVAVHKELDTYLLSFFDAMTYYEGCYSCKYACNERVSDITIGDFWGLGLEKPFDHPYTGAISLVLVNTDKGKNFFDKVKQNCFVEEREVAEGLKGNDQLNRPSKKHKNRTDFLNKYLDSDFDSATMSIYGEHIKKYKSIIRKNNRNRKIRSFAKKILRR